MPKHNAHVFKSTPPYTSYCVKNLSCNIELPITAACTTLQSLRPRDTLDCCGGTFVLILLPCTRCQSIQEEDQSSTIYIRECLA